MKNQENEIVNYLQDTAKENNELLENSESLFLNNLNSIGNSMQVPDNIDESLIKDAKENQPLIEQELSWSESEIKKIKELMASMKPKRKTNMQLSKTPKKKKNRQSKKSRKQNR